MNSRERFLAAAHGKPVDRPPVWLMRQAGRYLPEYQSVRSGHSFWDMCRNPELAKTVTMQPIDIFDMDAAILFSDILIVLDALGIDVVYAQGGPQISPLIRSSEQFEKLHHVDAQNAFSYVSQAVSLLAHELHPRDKALIGFTGAPFTLAAYAIEGGPAKHINATKELSYKNHPLYHHILEKITEVVIDLLVLQVEAGVDAIQLFDTWAWHLSPDDYDRLAFPYAKKVIDALSQYKKPFIYYVRNTGGHMQTLYNAGMQVLGVDSSVRLTMLHDHLPQEIALQGNFDNALLMASQQELEKTIHDTISYLHGRGYIVNLGQGLIPSSPVPGVRNFVEAVKSWKESV